jgi:hypothetical protein
MNPLFDGLKAAAEASTFGESIVCSGLSPLHFFASLTVPYLNWSPLHGYTGQPHGKPTEEAWRL